MKEIFTDFYKKVVGFFQAEKGENTKETATNRLKLVLLHDRTNLDTITMQKMREQLINVISKYIEIDTEALDLNLEGEGDSIALMLNIPVIKARTKEEIEELEKAEEDAKKEAMRVEIEAALAAQNNQEDSQDIEDSDNQDIDEPAMDTEAINKTEEVDENIQDAQPEESIEQSDTDSESDESETNNSDENETKINCEVSKESQKTEKKVKTLKKNNS